MCGIRSVSTAHDDHEILEHLVAFDVGAQGERRGLQVRVHEHAHSGHPLDAELLRAEALHEVGQRPFHPPAVRGDDLSPPVPGRHQQEQDRGDDQRQPAAVNDLREVRREERDLDRQEHRSAEHHERPRPVPQQPRHRQEQDRAEDEGARDRHAVGGREARRGAEADRDHQHGHEQQRVDRRRVDLADVPRGGVADRQARQEPDLDRLLGDAEGARDHRLRGDHGRKRREEHGRVSAPTRAPAGRTGLRPPSASAGSARPGRGS